jgi:DNA-binding MarR family transcriptional regulator
MRTPNIKDLNVYRRREFHNPLFNLLTNEFDDLMLEKSLSDEYILENLYVDNRTGERIVREKLFNLWTKTPQDVSRSGDLHSGMQRNNHGLVYLLLGKKGTGKTITLKRISLDIRKGTKDEDNLHVIYLDLMTKKSDVSFLDKLSTENDLPISLMEEIYDTIKDDTTKKEMGSLSDYLTEIKKMRELDDNYKFFKEDEDVVKDIRKDKPETIRNLFRRLSALEHKTYLIIDNIDDFPIISIKSIIDKCLELMRKYNLKCIIALRDYWNPQNLKIDDKNICSYYLTKPDIFEILKKRLNLMPIDNIKEGYEIQYGKHSLKLEAKDIVDTFHCVVKGITSEKEIHEKLYKLANYDTREHLFNMYHFFHSPYLYSKPMFIQVLIEKIKQIDKDCNLDGIRKPQFFDFIECAMAIHALCYDTDASKIFNIFFHKYEYKDMDDYQNTLIYIRILQTITKVTEDKNKVIENLTSIGYDENALRHAINILFEKALIESVQGNQEEYATDISISEKGKLYLEELINEYSYLLFVCDAVPMPNNYKMDIDDKFGKEDIPLTRGTLTVKNQSVMNFVEFIKSEEENEMDSCETEYYGVLSRIRGEDGTSDKMRECVNQTMNRMTKSSRNTQKIENVRIINIKK